MGETGGKVTGCKWTEVVEGIHVRRHVRPGTIAPEGLVERAGVWLTLDIPDCCRNHSCVVQWASSDWVGFELSEGP